LGLGVSSLMTFKMALLMFDARWTPLTARLQLVAAKFWAGMAGQSRVVGA
jgi:hypothetical protein